VKQQHPRTFMPTKAMNTPMPAAPAISTDLGNSLMITARRPAAQHVARQYNHESVGDNNAEFALHNIMRA
jgi:hypothetical protein